MTEQEIKSVKFNHEIQFAQFIPDYPRGDKRYECGPCPEDRVLKNGADGPLLFSDVLVWRQLTLTNCPEYFDGNPCLNWLFN